MTTFTIRDWRSRPRQAQRCLAAGGQAVLTSNGRPVALLVAVSAESLDETMAVLRRARALQALQSIRQDARARGLDRLAMAQVDRVIAASRRARRKPAAR
jgi:antitoxin (DNA-binding transcriptional repressor) of toxin-antitoxin stability system